MLLIWQDRLTMTHTLFSFNDRLNLPNYPPQDITLESMHVSQIEIRIEFIWDIDIFQSYFLMCFTKIGLLTCLDFLKKFQKKISPWKVKLYWLLVVVLTPKELMLLLKFKASETTSELAFSSETTSRQGVGSAFVEMWIHL